MNNSQLIEGLAEAENITLKKAEMVLNAVAFSPALTLPLPLDCTPIAPHK